MLLAGECSLVAMLSRHSHSACAARLCTCSPNLKRSWEAAMALHQVSRFLQGPKRPGERIYKGHRSYDLMLNLQLGIRYSVGGEHARPSGPMLLPTDFQFAVCVLSPSGFTAKSDEIFQQASPTNFIHAMLVAPRHSPCGEVQATDPRQ